MSLRRRFILVFVSFAVVLTALGGWAAWAITRDALEEEIDRRLLWAARAAAAAGLQGEPFYAGVLASVWDDPDSPPFIRYQLSALHVLFDETYIMNGEGLVGGSDDAPTGQRLDFFYAEYRSELEEAHRVGEAITELAEAPDGTLFKYVIHRLRSGLDTEAGLPLSEARFFVGRAPADYREPLFQLRNRIIGLSAIAALVAAFLAWRLATGVVQPISRLSRAATRIQRGRLDRAVAVERADELGQLSRAMDRMRLGVLERDERLRLMLAQVAHEIRNPLGGLELFASAAAETEDPTERARILSRIRDEVDGLEAIISDFLTFARPPQPAEELTDVRGPLLEAAELVEQELASRGGTLEADLPTDPLFARVQPDQLKRVTLNLLRNASQAGDHVRLHASWLNGEVRVSVRDDGPGVPEELRPRIFDPFVTDKEQGAGLGLAIVRQIVEANGGRAELAEDGPASGGEGAEFHLYFRGDEDLPPDDDEMGSRAAATSDRVASRAGG